MCNLECAVLLSKWLLTLASIGPTDPPLSAEEKNLLEMVRRMLDETEFAVPIDPSLAGSSNHHNHNHGHAHSHSHGHNSSSSRSVDLSATDSTKLRQLACAVTRLWAETFKGADIFEIVRLIAVGLEGYADMMEKPRDRTPLGRLVPNQGLG